MRPLALHKGQYVDVLMTSENFSGASSGRNFAEWIKTWNMTVWNIMAQDHLTLVIVSK